MSRTVFCLMILFGSSVVIGGQQTLRSRLLLATVTDTGSRRLFDLGPDDFVVDERGESRDVLSVHLADYPIGVLLDNSIDARDQIDAIRAAASRFVTRAGERPIAVLGLATPDMPLASFDDDRGAVLAALGRLGPAAGHALPLEAAARMTSAIRETGAPFSAIVVISAAAVDPQSTTAADLLNPILETGAVIHVVAYRPGETAQAGSNDLLRALADQTHGQYTVIFSPLSYSIAIDRLADRLATEMMIEFVLPEGATAGGDVRVGVRIPGARVTGLGVR